MARDKNQQLLLNVVMIVVGMFGLAYASVPLYDLFCRVTGFDGTTQQAAEYPNYISDRKVKVRFNAVTNPDLPWQFEAEQVVMDMRVGEPGLAYFWAENKADTATTGTSIYNVTPPKAGGFFNKVQCFCFEEQTLEPGQRMRFPVSFFIDPDMLQEKNLDDVETITLSYTFFPVKNDG